MSPDPEGVITPGEPDVRLAASGIDVAQDVATMALGMIHDTPAIRRKHEKMVQTTLQGLTETSKPMVALITPVSARFSELADEYRRKGYDITGGGNERSGGPPVRSMSGGPVCACVSIPELGRTGPSPKVPYGVRTWVKFLA